MGVVLLFPLTSFAQSREALESKLVNTLRDTTRSLGINRHNMSNQGLVRAEELLEKVKKISISGLENAPLPPVVKCRLDESTDNFKATHKRIADFSYSPNGLYYSNIEAGRFADVWVARYPCNVVDRYIQDFETIYFYATVHLQILARTETNAFIVSHIDKLCTGVNLTSLYTKYFDEARRSNFSRSEARGYARGLVESRAFSCKNF